MRSCMGKHRMNQSAQSMGFGVFMGNRDEVVVGDEGSVNRGTVCCDVDLQ